jgi:hypothetical protein
MLTSDLRKAQFSITDVSLNTMNETNMFRSVEGHDLEVSVNGFTFKQVISVLTDYAFFFQATINQCIELVDTKACSNEEGQDCHKDIFEILLEHDLL